MAVNARHAAVNSSLQDSLSQLDHDTDSILRAPVTSLLQTLLLRCRKVAATYASVVGDTLLSGEMPSAPRAAADSASDGARVAAPNRVLVCALAQYEGQAEGDLSFEPGAIFLQMAEVRPSPTLWRLRPRV